MILLQFRRGPFLCIQSLYPLYPLLVSHGMLRIGSRPRMAATVRLWREAEGHWRWAFEDGDLAIASNHPYATRREAVEAARTAYPGVPIEETGSAGSKEEGRVGLLACALMTLAIWRHYRPGRG